jgi:hypothetical protein
VPTGMREHPPPRPPPLRRRRAGGAFKLADVDMSNVAWAFADHLTRCGGDASVYTAHSWLVTAFVETISKFRGALGVGNEALTDPTLLVQLPNGNDGLPANADVDF